MPEACDPSLVYVRSRPIADIDESRQTKRQADVKKKKGRPNHEQEDLRFDRRGGVFIRM